MTDYGPWRVVLPLLAEDQLLFLVDTLFSAALNLVVRLVNLVHLISLQVFYYGAVLFNL